MSLTDQEALEEEQLRLAIENSLADLRVQPNPEPLNEFDSQDLAFFTDLAISQHTGDGNGKPREKPTENTVINSPASVSHPAKGKGTVTQPPNVQRGGQLKGGAGTFAQPNMTDTDDSSLKNSSAGTFARPSVNDIDGGVRPPAHATSGQSQPKSSTGGIFGKLSSLLTDNKPNNRTGADRAVKEPSASEGDLCRACLQPCSNSVFRSFSTIRAANNDLYHADCFICGTCRNPIRGQYLQHSSSPYPYHPDCFRCGGCDLPISGNFKDFGDPPQAYHAECYKELYHPRCCLCTHTLEGQFYKHPFFESEMYCMSHDSLPSCFACARKQPLPASRREGFADLMDGRSLCAQCSSSIIVDSSEAAALYKGIVEFMGRELGLTISPEMADVPVLVVDVQSLNENMNRKDGSLGYHDAGEDSVGGKSTVRGVTLSTCCEVRHFPSGSVAFSQVAGAFRSGQAPALFTTSEVRDVTAVLVLYGLPKDLIASILAHEAMHVWLKLNKKFPFRMPPKLEEGLCQVIAYLYLENLRAYDAVDPVEHSSEDNKDASLRSYFCKQIRDDVSPVYGDGFRDAYKAVQLLGLEIVLEYVQENHQLPEITL